jgi:hypothetical protein
MKNNIQVNPEDVSLEMIIEIFALWDKIYPDRLSPGEACERGHYIHNKGRVEFVDYRKNTELAPKKYYSDGIAIDWDNIFMSNLAYEKRCEEDEFKLPGIDKAVTLYFHIKEN